MTHKQTSKTWLVFVPVILAICYLAGCTAKTVNVWGDPQTGLILQYRMPEGQVLEYQTSAEQTESGEVMGQTFEVETRSASTFSFRSKGLKENNHQLEVTIDSMSIDITSPQGDLSPDMSSVIGKSFDMILSPLGKELDVSGAESIEYEISGNTRNLAAVFQALFPDLAEKPVKIEDSWTTKDTITDISDTSEIHINLENVNTLEGFETVDGLECVKIKAKATGNLDGEGSQGGASLTFKGEIEGTGIWYFAYKEGIFVKMKGDVFVDATVDVSGPQSMTIPTKQERKAEIKLINK